VYIGYVALDFRRHAYGCLVKSILSLLLTHNTKVLMTSWWAGGPRIRCELLSRPHHEQRRRYTSIFVHRHYVELRISRHGSIAKPKRWTRDETVSVSILTHCVLEYSTIYSKPLHTHTHTHTHTHIVVGWCLCHEAYWPIRRQTNSRTSQLADCKFFKSLYTIHQT